MIERYIDIPYTPIVPFLEPLVGPERVYFGKFSSKQREWIRRRDTDPITGLLRCQFQGFSKRGDWLQCPLNEKNYGGRKNFHAHHIVPQGWWDQLFRFGKETESPNQPWNAITLCGKIHHNGPKGIHPDYADALREYGINPNGFKQVAELHHQLTLEHIPYWTTNYDEILFQIAKERTEDYLLKNPMDVWPCT